MMNSPFYNRNSLPAKKKKKVVSVPVHFISSDQPPTLMSRESAALKIQKVFRGFLVRKSVNKISAVRKEIVNMEQRIMKKEFINSISEDPKERLRVNETLMSLLLKLDSIRGFDCGVRDFRKSVTKKAIAVQDKVDSIAQPPQPQPDDDSNSNKENEEEEIDVEENSCVGKGGDFCAGPPSIKEEEEEERRWEKVICDNDKMMKVMCERNEMQRRMINSLSRRVEQLEKAFLIDHLTRMNNKNQKKKKKTKSNASRRRGRRGPGWIIHDDDDER